MDSAFLSGIARFPFFGSDVAVLVGSFQGCGVHRMESQSCGMAGVGRDLKEHLVSTPCHGQGCLYQLH